MLASATDIVAADVGGIDRARSASIATASPTLREACSLSSQRTSSRSQYACTGSPMPPTASCAVAMPGRSTSLVQRSAADASEMSQRICRCRSAW